MSCINTTFSHSEVSDLFLFHNLDHLSQENLELDEYGYDLQTGEVGVFFIPNLRPIQFFIKLSSSKMTQADKFHSSLRPRIGLLR